MHLFKSVYIHFGVPVDSLVVAQLGVGGVSIHLNKLCIIFNVCNYPTQGSLSVVEILRPYPTFSQLFISPRNLGRVRFASFKRAIEHMGNANHEEAATEFLESKWARQVKGRALEITDQISTNTYV